MTSSAGGSPVADGRQDIAHRGRRGEPHRRIAKAEPDRAQPHLVGRFLARDIDDLAARARASRAATWSSRVDLPMPGSPPISIAEPATIPPPIARSNSAMPLGSRSGSAAGVRARPAGSRARRPGDCAWRRRCSTPRPLPGPACSTRRNRRTAPASGATPTRRPGRRSGTWAWPWCDA